MKPSEEKVAPNIQANIPPMWETKNPMKASIMTPDGKTYTLVESQSVMKESDYKEEIKVLREKVSELQGIIRYLENKR